MHDAIFEKKNTIKNKIVLMSLGYLTHCVALEKMGGYAYLKLTNSKIQMRFRVEKNQKLEKLLI